MIRFDNLSLDKLCLEGIRTALKRGERLVGHKKLKTVE
jgi:hypothetical protein